MICFLLFVGDGGVITLIVLLGLCICVHHLMFGLRYFVC